MGFRVARAWPVARHRLVRHRTPADVVPTLVRDYTVQARVAGDWTEIGGETGNRRRHRIITLDNPVCTDAVRVLVHATNGARRAHLVAVRVSPPD